MIEETTFHRKKDPSEFYPVDFALNDAVAAKMYNALMVIALDPNIKSFLSNLDPKALEQVEDAIEVYKASYQESTCDNI